MKLKITIDMDNAAFDGDSGTEAARILRKTADTIDGLDLAQGETLSLRDINGNAVGEAKVTR